MRSSLSKTVLLATSLVNQPKWKAFSGKKMMLLAMVFAGSLLLSAAQSSQTDRPAGQPGKAVTSGTPYRNQPSHMSNRAREYYGLVWGVEGLRAKVVESGEMVRFSYRVLDAQLAKGLNDKKAEPSLICPDKRVRLVVPSLEKVGQLRQSSTPEAGKTYWMAFSNKGGIVKRGDRVNIVIGNFHADGIEVE